MKIQSFTHPCVIPNCLTNFLLCNIKDDTLDQLYLGFSTPLTFTIWAKHSSHFRIASFCVWLIGTTWMWVNHGRFVIFREQSLHMVTQLLALSHQKINMRMFLWRTVQFHLKVGDRFIWCGDKKEGLVVLHVIGIKNNAKYSLMFSKKCIWLGIFLSCWQKVSRSSTDTSHCFISVKVCTISRFFV